MYFNYSNLQLCFHLIIGFDLKVTKVKDIALQLIHLKFYTKVARVQFCKHLPKQLKPNYLILCI